MSDRRSPETIEEAIRETLEQLSPRDAEVLRLRYLHGFTLREVGMDLNLTAERIRQIEGRALVRIAARSQPLVRFVIERGLQRV